jgi:hypothetical protein
MNQIPLECVIPGMRVRLSPQSPFHEAGQSCDWEGNEYDGTVTYVHKANIDWFPINVIWDGELDHSIPVLEQKGEYCYGVSDLIFLLVNNEQLTLFLEDFD